MHIVRTIEDCEGGVIAFIFAVVVATMIAMALVMPWPSKAEVPMWDIEHQETIREIVKDPKTGCNVVFDKSRQFPVHVREDGRPDCPSKSSKPVRLDEPPLPLGERVDA